MIFVTISPFNSCSGERINLFYISLAQPHRFRCVYVCAFFSSFCSFVATKKYCIIKFKDVYLLFSSVEPSHLSVKLLCYVYEMAVLFSFFFF